MIFYHDYSWKEINFAGSLCDGVVCCNLSFSDINNHRKCPSSNSLNVIPLEIRSNYTSISYIVLPETENSLVM